MSAARPPEGARTVGEAEGIPVSAARPPEGARTAGEAEGIPVSAARPPEGARTAGEAEGTPVRAGLLGVRGLCAAYGRVPVLESVDIDVPQGGITALLGANGAGKTSLLRAISNALVSTRGRIELSGQRIDGLSTDAIARLGVAHVPDGRGTFAQLSVEENLLVGAISRGDRVQVRADLARVYGLFPRLAEYRHKMAGLLSGGEQQMLAISRALMLRPRLLMLDEPSFGLAPLVVRQIFDVLAEVNRATGLGILVVEQNARLALDLAHHAYVLEMGRVAISGPAGALKADPRVRAAYLGI